MTLKVHGDGRCEERASGAASVSCVKACAGNCQWCRLESTGDARWSCRARILELTFGSRGNTVAINIREAGMQDYDGLCKLIEHVDALHRDHRPEIFRKPDGPTRARDYI